MPMNLMNKTSYQAYFMVLQGELAVVGRIELAPDANAELPAPNLSRTVIATTVLDGNMYTSQPVEFIGAAGFRAQVRQAVEDNIYVFELVEMSSTQPNQLQFQKTCLGPVVFSIVEDGEQLQNVTVNNTFEMVSLNISDTYSIYAIINGITTDTVQTNNPQATISAVVDTSSLESGYYTLVVS